MSRTEGSFSPLRGYLWPIHSHELVKFLPLLVMAFFIGFNYNILRNMKDALLVTAENSGAEVIPFIKVWGIVPGAFLMTYLYSRLNNRLGRDKVFYALVGVFLIFFALFTFVIYPFHSHLQPDSAADYLHAHLPAGFNGLIAMFRYWTFSIFYIMSELWSSAILSMLFWGFANEVTAIGEAKRFYVLIALGLNVAAIVSGQVSVFLTSEFLRTWLTITDNSWHQSIILLTTAVLCCGLIIMGIYKYTTKRLLKGASADVHLEPKKKIKMSMRENFSLIARSKYLLYLTIIVLAYNIVINLIEVIWKDQVRQLYPQPNDFTAYMSQITTITGIISVFVSLFLSGYLFRKYGWTLAALITPIILLITSIAFFIFFFGHESLIGMLSILGTSPLALVVFFGSMQNCLARASKFTLFDATKEIAFIPLSLEDKIKGKAAIDGIGSRIGKSAGSLIHQGLLVIFVTISASAHIVAGILFVVIALWLIAVFSLGKRFNLLSPDPLLPAVELDSNKEKELQEQTPIIL